MCHTVWSYDAITYSDIYTRLESFFNKMTNYNDENLAE